MSDPKNDYENELRVLRENTDLVAEMIGASSIAVVPGEFSEPPEGTRAIDFKFGAFEARMFVPARSREEERARLIRELEQLTEIVDNQLDVLDPAGAWFGKKASLWFRRKTAKKKKADDTNPAQSLLCGERLLRRLEILKELKELT